MLSFSVVTPSYNQADFLEQTMRSVLDQGYPCLEYAVMDGGSKDGSKGIIRRYENRLTLWVSKKDRGQGDAVNKGIARTTGEIIGWLNSDDLYLPYTLETVSRYFEEHPETDAVYGDVLSIDGAGKLTNVMRFAPYTVKDLMGFRVISQPGVFFRRSLWEKSGGLDLSYHYLLDHHLWLRMMPRGRFDCIPQPLAAARFHEAAKNRAHTADFGKEAYRLVKWMMADPLLSQQALSDYMRLFGAAAWLDAHYLSDGGMAWKSLSAYFKALRLYPERVWEDKKRLLLTMVMAVSPALAERIYQKQSAKRAVGLRDYQNLLPQTDLHGGISNHSI